jgi:hypothetical protein
MKTSIAVLIGIIVLGAGAYFYSKDGALPETSSTERASNSEEVADSSMTRAEDNAVVVNEQRPGNTVIGSLVYLDSPGFLVIHEAGDGEPGAILGASAALPAGESTEVVVNLSRASRERETLYAMLHFDTDGNGRFEASKDAPVPSQLGGPIYGWFDISSSADVGVPVSI